MIWELPDPLRSAALARPDHVALRASDGDRTWQDLDARAEGTAAHLRREGVEPGMVVGLVGPARGAWIVALHGLLRIGATVAPLPHRGTAQELRQALETLDPERVLVVEGGGPAVDEALSDAAPDLRVDHDEAPSPADPTEERWARFDEPALALLTSGTTGRPRPVTLRWGQLVMSACGTALRLGHHLDDRWLCCLPLHHVGGLMVLLRSSLTATSVSLHERFDASAVAAALDGGEASCVSLAPAMLAATLDARAAGRAFPPSLRQVLVGGERLPETLRTRCQAIGLPLTTGWGMTETASHVSLGSPGVPTPFARIEGDDAGRLVVRGPMAGGRLRTRDVGVVEGGRVHVEGRADRVLTSGGESYHPAEIEEVLAKHPAVGDAAVSAVRDERWGQRPVALLVQARGQDRPTDDVLSQWCRTRLSRHKMPARFEWTERLPRKMADA